MIPQPQPTVGGREASDQRKALAHCSTAGGTAQQQALSAGRASSQALADDPHWTVLLLAFWADSVDDPERRERLEGYRAPLRDEIAAVIAATAKRTRSA